MAEASARRNLTATATALNYLGQNALLEQDHATARRHLIEARVQAQKLSAPPLTLAILVHLAHCSAQQGEVNFAVQLLTLVCAQPATTHHTHSMAQTLLAPITSGLATSAPHDRKAGAAVASLDEVVARVLSTQRT